MTAAIVALLKTVAINSVKMFLSFKGLMWGLKIYAKQTDNLIDDNVVAYVDAAYKNDIEGMKKFFEAGMEEFNKLNNKKSEDGNGE